MRLRRVFLHDNQRFVKLKSLRPSWGPYGLEWVTFLADRKGGGRETVTLIWNYERLMAPFRNA